MMTPAEIAARLDERFRLLTGGSRTAVERHQTLRQAVDWSYDLLDPRERTVLNRIGVFAGGFTLDAAESVAEGSDIEAYDVLDAIATARRQVPRRRRRDSSRDSIPAPRDHPSIRARTARRRGRRRTPSDAFTPSGAHDFADTSTRLVVGPDERIWRDRLDREIDNLRAAITWAVDRDDTDLAMRLIGRVPYGRS